MANLLTNLNINHTKSCENGEYEKWQIRELVIREYLL